MDGNGDGQDAMEVRGHFRLLTLSLYLEKLAFTF